MIRTAAVEAFNVDARASILTTAVLNSNPLGYFTADDVRWAHTYCEGVPAPHANYWGIAFRAAAAAGYIEKVGATQAMRLPRAKGLTTVWVATPKAYALFDRVMGA